MPITNNLGVQMDVVAPPSMYQLVPASSSATALKTSTGSLADYIENLIVVVATAATAQVQLTDGTGSAFTVFPNSPGGGVGTYVLKLQIKSNSGTWKVTTGAGVSVIATGSFA